MPRSIDYLFLRPTMGWVGDYQDSDVTFFPEVLGLIGDRSAKEVVER